MTFLQGKQYVARALGAAANTGRLAAAADAIAAAIEEWNLRHDWRFLLMDTRNGFSVSSCTIAGDGVSVTVASPGFAGVNPGVTVTGTGIPASTTVLATPAPTVTAFTLSAASTPGTITMTFSGDIPVRQDVDLYNLPTIIKRPLEARLEVNQRTLFWKDQNIYDRLIVNQSPRSTPIYWNTFNDSSFAQSRQSGRVRLMPIPGSSDTLRVRYFRPIAQPSADGDILDMPDRYTFAMLEMGRYYFLQNQDAELARLGETKERSDFMFRTARYDDLEGSIDREVLMIPQMDHGVHRQIDSDDIIFGEF